MMGFNHLDGFHRANDYIPDPKKEDGLLIEEAIKKLHGEKEEKNEEID